MEIQALIQDVVKDIIDDSGVKKILSEDIQATFGSSSIGELQQDSTSEPC